MHYFRCNFDGRKIHMVSTQFFDVLLMVEKSTLFPLTFIGVISMVEICTLFLRNFDGQRFDIVFGKWQANENIREGFSCIYNFKQLTFSSKSPWCSPVPQKFESYNLHHCKKNCCKFIFMVFTEQHSSKYVLGSYIAMKLLL